MQLCSSICTREILGSPHPQIGISAEGALLLQCYKAIFGTLRVFEVCAIPKALLLSHCWFYF